MAISFTEWNGITSPTFIGIENYERAAHDKTFWLSFKNNLYIIVSMTVIPTIAGLLLASFLYDYVANKIGKTAANIFRAGYYLPQILPVAIAASSGAGFCSRAGAC